MANETNTAKAGETPGRIGFLGPVGTFSHEAALSQPDLANYELVAYRSITEVFEAVDKGEILGGVVPLENTIEGSVSLTLDMLIFDSEAMIQREIDQNISLCIATKDGTKKEDIKTIYSHPHALAQCRGYIDKNYSYAETKATDSTSQAAELIANETNQDHAAICSIQGAQRLGLEIVDSHIQDKDFNQTRFVLIGNGIPKETGNDKTSIVVFQRENQPGSLLAILNEFSKLEIDLTKLESRPTKEGLGQYCFLMDFVGHISQEKIAQCLTKIRLEHADIKFLGSFKVAGDKEVQISNGKEKIWKKTDEWLTDLLNKVEDS